MPYKNSQQAGFTLLELMITLTIVTILITVAIPKYQDYQVRTKYISAVSQLGADKNAIINTAILDGFSFAEIPLEQQDQAGMQKHFALRDTSGNEYLSENGGKKKSDSDFMLYQFVDKDAMRAPEIAPEMVAMAVVINENGAFSYHCHYYHSAFEWDYEGGDKYVSLSCDTYTENPSNIVSGSEDSSSADSSANDTSDNDNAVSSPEFSGDNTSGATSSDDAGSENTVGLAPTSSDGNDNNKSKPDCDHGEKVINNNGHGNNVDGVDSSNPGEGNKKNDESCTGDKCIDDEKGRKK